MKKTAILINLGRGPLIDDEAVAEALKNDNLGAFCADVLTQEPPIYGNPLIDAPRSYITPHMAWATEEARTRLINIAVDNVAAFIEGKKKNVVSQ